MADKILSFLGRYMPGRKQIGLGVVLWVAHGFVGEGLLSGEMWMWAAIAGVAGGGALSKLAEARTKPSG